MFVKDLKIRPGLSATTKALVLREALPILLTNATTEGFPPLYVKGPLFPVKVRFVSAKQMKKAWGKNEQIVGMYSAEHNEILLSRLLEREELRHTILHEFIHACDHQLHDFEDEDRADVMGTWIGGLI